MNNIGSATVVLKASVDYKQELLAVTKKALDKLDLDPNNSFAVNRWTKLSQLYVQLEKQINKEKVVEDEALPTWEIR